MALVTLIGEKLAKKGNEFVYLGPQNDCRNCKLKNVCFNLKKGRRYEITNVRDKRHSCSVHDASVAVVEVKELPITTSIAKKLSEGSTVKIEKKECNNIGCENYSLCFCDEEINEDKKYKILKTYKSIDCPAGYDLQKADIQESE